MQKFLEPFITIPFLNILFLLYVLIPGHDFGIAIIILTLLIRFALYPLAKKQLHSQKALSALQPEMAKIKEKYKDDPQAQQAATLELYKEKDVNPFGSCLPLLIQLPFLFALFYAIMMFKDQSFLSLVGDGGILGKIYPYIKDLSFVKNFIAANDAINTNFFGLTDLAKPSIYFAVVAGLLQFVQSKMLLPKKQEKDAASAISSQMTYFFPVITVVFAAKLPAALPLYWSVTTIFAIVQQYLVMHHDVEELEEAPTGKKKNRKRQRRKKK